MDAGADVIEPWKSSATRDDPICLTYRLGILDKVNGKWGRNTLGMGSAGAKGDRAWTMQRGMMSPCYTTSWDELRTVS